MKTIIIRANLNGSIRHCEIPDNSLTGKGFVKVSVIVNGRLFKKRVKNSWLNVRNYSLDCISTEAERLELLNASETDSEEETKSNLPKMTVTLNEDGSIKECQREECESMEKESDNENQMYEVTIKINQREFKSNIIDNKEAIEKYGKQCLKMAKVDLEKLFNHEKQ
jgi:hypothetical protein